MARLIKYENFLIFPFIMYLVWPKYLSLPLVSLNAYSLSMLIFLIFGCFWSLRQWFSNWSRGIFDFSAIVVLISIFVDFISIFMGSDYASANDLLRYTLQVKLIFFLGYVSAEKIDIKHIFNTLVFCVSIVSCIGLWESISNKLIIEVLQSLFSAITLESYYHIIEARSSTGVLRVQSITDHPIVFGSLVGSILPAIFLIYKKTIQSRILACFLCIIFMSCIVLSGSRSSILAALVSVTSLVMMVTFFSGHRKSKLYSSILLSFIILLLMSSADFFSDMLRGRNDFQIASSSMRFEMWERSFFYIGRSPLIGWGFGSSLNLVGLSQSSFSNTVDDSYLSLLVDGGILACLLVFILFINLLFNGFYLIRFESNSRSRCVMLLLSMCLSIAIVQKFNSIPYLFGLVYYFAGYFSGYRSTLRIIR